MKMQGLSSAGIFAVLYGPSKTGKSTATGAIGACGLFIAQPGGLLPLNKFLGLDDVQYVCPVDVTQAAKIVTTAAGKHSTIVVDDFSLLVEQTVQQLEAKHSFGDMWRALRHQVLTMREAARAATAKGTHVIFNCHEAPPKTSSGKYVRGGPKLPGQLPEQFSAFADVVARVSYEETAAPWKYVIRTGPSHEYVSGDRLDVLPDPSPMNLAEGLRAAGYEIPRPKAVAWHEACIASLSAKVVEDGIENWRETLKPASVKLLEKYSPQHVRWALQDALHRAVIQTAHSEKVLRMFEENNEDSW